MLQNREFTLIPPPTLTWLISIQLLNKVIKIQFLQVFMSPIHNLGLGFHEKLKFVQSQLFATGTVCAINNNLGIKSTKLWEITDSKHCEVSLRLKIHKGSGI